MAFLWSARPRATWLWLAPASPPPTLPFPLSTLPHWLSSHPAWNRLRLALVVPSARNALPSDLPVAPLSLSSGLCSRRPSLTSDEKPPLPCTASLFFLALFTTKMASVSICLSLRGWKPPEGRDIICLVYPIPAKQKPAVLYWIEEEMGEERGWEGKEFRNCLVLKYIRKYTKEKGTSLSLLFFFFFGIFIYFYSLFFYTFTWIFLNY